MTSTEELTKPARDADAQEDDGAGPKDGEMFHYVRKDKIIKSAVDGDHVVALCGEVFPVTRVPKKNSPVCPECKRVLDRMQP